MSVSLDVSKSLLQKHEKHQKAAWWPSAAPTDVGTDGHEPLNDRVPAASRSSPGGLAKEISHRGAFWANQRSFSDCRVSWAHL